LVILELGANDGLRGLPVAQMQTNLEAMIKDFQGAGAKVVLAGMTLPRNYGLGYLISFENTFRDLAKKHNTALIPFFLEGVAGDPKYTLDDLIHPNAAGYVRVTDIVLKTLEPLPQEIAFTASSLLEDSLPLECESRSLRSYDESPNP
jgi:acyl-CoA thioesterase-1